jgi:hypothetical protein
MRRRISTRRAIASRRRWFVTFFLDNVFKAERYSCAILAGPNKGNNIEFREFVNSFGLRVCRFTQRNARILPGNMRYLFYSYTFVLYGRNKEKFIEFFKNIEWINNFSADFTVIYLAYNKIAYYEIDDWMQMLEQQEFAGEQINEVQDLKVDKNFYLQIIVTCRMSFISQFLKLFYNKFPSAIPKSFVKYGINY